MVQGRGLLENIIAVLTRAVGSASKRSLIAVFTVSGPVPRFLATQSPGTSCYIEFILHLTAMQYNSDLQFNNPTGFKIQTYRWRCAP